MPSRSPRLLLCLLLFLAACRSAASKTPPSPLLPTVIFTTASVQPPAAPPPALPSPEVLPPRSPEPAPTPTPAPTAHAHAPVTPRNAISLTQTLEIRYSPWELVLDLAWSPDGRLLAVSAGEAIHLYQAPAFTETLVISTSVWITALAFNPEGTKLASAGRDGTISVWNAASGEQLHTRLAHKKGANSVAFSPDGLLLASGGNDAIARLWDAASGETRGQMIGGTYSVPALAFDPSGSSVAIVNGSVIRWREAASTRILHTLYAPESIYSMAFNPAGDRLATGDSAGQVQVWDYALNELVFTLAHNPAISGAAALVWQVAYSPDGTLLVSAGGDGMLQLWQVSNGARLASLAAHRLAASSAAFSPEGHWLASGGLDGVVRLWQAQP